MIRCLTIITLCLGLFACRDKSAQLRYQKLLSKHQTLDKTYQDLATTHEQLKARFDSVSLKNADLRNTPSRRLVEIRKLARESELTKAEKEAEELVKLYPHTEEGKIAKDFIEKLEKRRETKRLEEAQAKEAKLEKEARKKRLGFKVLAEKLNIIQGNSVLRFSDFLIAKHRISDRCQGRQVVEPAPRSHHFLSATLLINSIKSPKGRQKVPPIELYSYSDGKLVHHSGITYKFYKWASYAAYRANKEEYGHSFQYVSSIPYSISAYVEDAVLQKPLFLLVRKTDCIELDNTYVVRQSDGTSYGYLETWDYCRGDDETLTLEQALKYYHTIKIFNKDKL